MSYPVLPPAQLTSCASCTNFLASVRHGLQVGALIPALAGQPRHFRCHQGSHLRSAAYYDGAPCLAEQRRAGSGQRP
eukprot:3931454-Amphidinium_carterae.1